MIRGRDLLTIRKRMVPSATFDPPPSVFHGKGQVPCRGAPGDQPPVLAGDLPPPLRAHRNEGCPRLHGFPYKTNQENDDINAPLKVIKARFQRKLKDNCPLVTD